MNKIKIAFIGAGYMATEHAKAFSSFDEFTIVGICSRTQIKAEVLAAEYKTQVFSNIEEMYKQTQADLVIIAVNELSLLDVCQQVFQYSWLCFLEKPVGYNYEQACIISKLAFEKDHKPYVAFNRRSYSSTRTALDYLKNNDNGTRLVSILDQENIDSAIMFGQPELVAHNFMYANSIHLIDYFNVFCRGTVLSVESTVPWQEDNPSYVVSTIKYTSGDIGVYTATWNGPGPWSVSITNSNVRLEMRPLELLKIQLSGERKAEEVAIDPVDTLYKPGLYYQAEQLLNYFKGKMIDLATLDDSLNSMKLCSLIYNKSN